MTSYTFRAATWNLREGGAGMGIDPASAQGSSIVDRITEIIASNEIDVIFLQEVHFDGRHANDSQIMTAIGKHTRLQNTLGVRLSQSAFEFGGWSGVGIATRYPITGRTALHLPNPDLPVTFGSHPGRSFDKGGIACAANVQGIDVHMISIHMFPFHRLGRDARDRDMSPVWDKANSFLQGATRPTLLAGDFNTEERDLLPDFAQGKLSSALGGMATHNGKATDDIVYSRHCRMIGEPSILENFSDHSVCIADFKVDFRDRPAEDLSTS